MPKSATNTAPETPKKRGRGRPPLPPELRRRVHSFRLSPASLDVFRDMAEATGRPMSRIVDDLILAAR